MSLAIPLPSSDHAFTGRISRGHYTRRIEGAVPQICMVGGKWTTFRAFAEQVADEVLTELNCSRQQCTASLSIGGGRDHPGAEQLTLELQCDFGMSPERAARLAGIYGTRARELLSHVKDYAPISPNCPYSREEFRWIVQGE